LRYLLMIIALATLCACATSGPNYTSANGSGGQGYHDSKLADGRYRVSYSGGRTDTAAEVKDLALLRAAELTMLEDFDWFRIVDRETVKNVEDRASREIAVRQPQRVTRDCGLLGCTSSVEPGYSGVGIASTQRDQRYETTLEIRMGKGEISDPSSIYNARELYKNLKASYP